ncbi:MAG: M20/M25/M40 family metallo-hydrolase [Clostridiales bacterium]|nr:M20/M25/M40 family metallo-hydrolase [Clostridiales bacterium]
MYFIPIIAVLIAIIVVLIIRTRRLRPVEHIYKKLETSHNVNINSVSEKLKKAIKCRTISYSDYSKFDFPEFSKFNEFLKNSFPRVFKEMTFEIVNGYSLLFKWDGVDNNLKPGLFMAHIDVVPIEKGTEEHWVYPPFSGEVAEGYVWGRGTMDIKLQIITMLEACELLIENGEQPKRTLYFAFGHDEETDGSNGARKIVEKLNSEGIKLEFVNDEGGCINKGIFSSVDKPLAFIGVAEKGFLNLKVEIKGKGGHASTPPANSSLGLAAKAICRIESKKMKLRLTEPAIKMIQALGRHMGISSRIIIANFWLFKPVFIKIFTTSGTTGEALLRTTIAPTMAEGSMEPNVLPQVSSFTVNCRILQGETYKDVIKHIEKACKGMEYNIKILRHEEPSALSNPSSEIYNKIAGAVRGLSDETAIIPYLMVAGTDSIKYECICENILRFSPYLIDMDDMKRIHGTNERISLENVERCVKFYLALFPKI